MSSNEIRAIGHALPPSPLHAAAENRIAELERENTRLHRLIAELLLKNQQLRRQQP
jgi:hypothetical protein